MALVANGAQAVLAIDGLMPVSDSDTAEPEVLGSFPAAGLGVLAALGDRLRDMDLRARLARQEVSPEDLLAPVSAQEVALFAGRGCTSPDLRSATGRLLLLAPEALEAAADMARAEAALRALRQAKVIAQDGGLSASGVLIARLLSQADPCAVFHGASVGGSGTTRDRIMVLRSGGRLFTVHWSGRTTDADAPVTVLACPPAEALRTLSTLFEAGA